MKKIVFTIASLALIGLSNKAEAQVCFAPASGSPFTSDTNPYSVISADFNGDGIKDLATANYNTYDVSILLGTGTGSFGTATNFAVGTQPTSVTSADFNGDGIKDLATANYNTYDVSIL